MADLDEFGFIPEGEETEEDLAEFGFEPGDTLPSTPSKEADSGEKALNFAAGAGEQVLQNLTSLFGYEPSDVQGAISSMFLEAPEYDPSTGKKLDTDKKKQAYFKALAERVDDKMREEGGFEAGEYAGEALTWALPAKAAGTATKGLRGAIKEGAKQAASKTAAGVGKVAGKAAEKAGDAYLNLTPMGRVMKTLMKQAGYKNMKDVLKAAKEGTSSAKDILARAGANEKDTLAKIQAKIKDMQEFPEMRGSESVLRNLDNRVRAKKLIGKEADEKLTNLFEAIRKGK